MTTNQILTLPQVAKTIDEYPEILTVSDPNKLFFHARDETRPVGDRTVIISFASMISAFNLLTLTSNEIFLIINALIPSGTVLDVTGSGTGYTYAGTTPVNLNASAALFNDDPEIEVNRNGVEQRRGQEVIWISPTQLYFTNDLLAGEQISIQKTELI